MRAAHISANRIVNCHNRFQSIEFDLIALRQLIFRAEKSAHNCSCAKPFDPWKSGAITPGGAAETKTGGPRPIEPLRRNAFRLGYAIAFMR
jgi:hypothetical protein